MGKLGHNAKTQTVRAIILGVDPGTLVTGYGVLSCATNGSFSLLEAGTIKNSSDQAMALRLKRIFEGLQALIAQYHPVQFALESAFYGKNAQSALKLGQARGVCLLAASLNGLPTGEYSPREVKLAVVGTGGASKQQVQYMVKSILHLDKSPMVLDASDAIAVALCHFHRSGSSKRPSSSWKAFVAQHPERLLP